MLYKKPKDIKYTDMCIYIDENIYGNFDEDLVFQYLFFISRMLSKKEKYFYSEEDLDNFGIYAATYYYLRLVNPKQFDEHNMQKIKSILNYIKSSLYAVKVRFQSMDYAQTISRESFEENNYNLNNLLYDNLNDIYISDFKLVMHNISQTCENFLKHIYYDENSVEWLNIYISVMLTFLNNITLDKRTINYINNLDNHNYLHGYHINNIYDDNWNSEPVLFHIPSNMSNYIKTLSKEVRNLVAKDLSEILDTKVSNDYKLIQNVMDTFVKEEINIESKD